MNEKTIIEKYHKLTRILIDNSLTVSTMESCTGGLVGMLLSDASGASEVVRGGIFAYTNEIKIKNGVDAAVINKYGVYSAETATAMATVAKKAFDSDIGIGITGSMGRIDPANPDSVPGEVYVGIDICGDIKNRLIIVDDAARYDQRYQVADEICDMLLKGGMRKQ